MGSVVFEPILGGKTARLVEFSQVLHVPDLWSNLLACLYLTHHKHFNISISVDTMTFHCASTPVSRVKVRRAWRLEGPVVVIFFFL
jgi:hypothetical protein